MIELKVTLPDWAGRFIEEQIATGNFASADEVLVDLIEGATAEFNDERWTSIVREGLQSQGGAEFSQGWKEEMTARLNPAGNGRQSA